jgi:acetyl/propionyl-CoA carboxylase alpha subunit
LGFKTAVGYADQDESLPFVQEADDAISLQGEEAHETYLDFQKVLSAAQKVRATHLHPGYGFLSENPKFVDACDKAQIVFVGPSSQSMRLLGDKIGSRAFLKNLGVPLLPAYDGDDQSEAALTREAKKLGFPLLVKPSAGGGGKGMLRVDDESEFLEKLRSSKRIAKAAFSDDRVFLEKLVENARHIEVQILADRNGSVISFGERECSLQKRHQKVIEEAPCIFLPEEIRSRIFELSRKVAHQANYSSLGTVEWIWDGKAGIYFLEVNARLQVEHPVTELVWHRDLVELQLRVALGEPLKDFQVEPKGHAIEARICAEDPERDFLPTGGKIHRLKLPADVRVDFGYREKNSIPSQFDSLIGKVISFGENREVARLKLIQALKELCIFGPATNRAYLLQLLQSQEVVTGALSTNLISKLPYAFDWKGGLRLLRDLPEDGLRFAEQEDADTYSPWGASPERFSESSSFFSEDFAGRRYFHSELGDWSAVRVDQRKLSSHDLHQGIEEDEVRSPMPGRVIKISAKVGDEIPKGQIIMVLEAMKMEHQIKANRSVKIREIIPKEGERVSLDAVLVRFETR